MRLVPDDAVYQVRAVWLGPQNMTFPWVARYLAYATWLATFLTVLLFEAITPLSVGLPPIWEIVTTTLFTYALMTFTDHERPVGSIRRTLLADLVAPRRPRPLVITYRPRIAEYVRVQGRLRRVLRRRADR